jgi:hypothetical protein
MYENESFGKEGTVFGAILVQEEVITFSPSFIAISPI